MKTALKITGILILFSFMSCTKDYYEPPNVMPQNVSFTNDVQSIFNAHCTECHNGGTIPLDLTEGNAYDQLMSTADLVDAGNPDNSELYGRLVGNGAIMPPQGPLSQNNINIIYVWIKEGALNN